MGHVFHFQIVQMDSNNKVEAQHLMLVVIVQQEVTFHKGFAKLAGEIHTKPRKIQHNALHVLAVLVVMLRVRKD